MEYQKPMVVASFAALDAIQSNGLKTNTQLDASEPPEDHPTIPAYEADE